MLSVLALWLAPRPQSTGTLVVLIAGPTGQTMPGATLMLHGSGAWSSLGTLSGGVPAAPEARTAMTLTLPVGAYDGVRLGADMAAVAVTVRQDQVEPLLLGLDSGRLIGGAAYAGNDQVNLGLGELAGRFVAMPEFHLVDQSGRTLDRAALAGKDVVVAAFHTTCHETCPLYTALFLQLAKRLPPGVMLLEVTTDPAVDTPAALSRYAGEIGAGWTFGTGTADQVAAFWKPFAVELSGADAHTSTLVLVDRHGYVRLVYRGVPKVGHDIPPDLVASLSATGLHELGSGGDGWGAPDVLDALTTITGAQQASQSGGETAPGFTLTSTDGSKVGLSGLAGRPLVINFWATYCPPCKAEMPMLAHAVASQPNARLVLVDEGDSPDAARSFLAALGVRQAALLDSDLAVGRTYGVFVLPVTVFVRADGTIDRRQVGQLDERVLAAELSSLSTQ